MITSLGSHGQFSKIEAEASKLLEPTSIRKRLVPPATQEFPQKETQTIPTTLETCTKEIYEKYNSITSKTSENNYTAQPVCA